MVNRDMSRRCMLCGREGAEILCPKCGSIICDRCYDEEADTCVVCSGKRPENVKTLNRPALLVGGFMMVLLGLMVTSWAFIPQGEAIVVLFPFIFNGVGGTAALIMSLAFFALFSMSSLLPLYLLLKRNDYTDWDEGLYTLHDSVVTGGNTSESLEYMITTEIPGGLKDSIYLEEEDDAIILMSSKDANFVKTYNLPEEYHIDEVESEFEGSFLLVKVRLTKDI
jgi:hypothetical protein